MDFRFRDALSYIADHILSPVYDMKEIQGDINNLDIEDKLRLQQKARTDYNKACEAWQQEQAGNHKEAIKKWGGNFLEATSQQRIIVFILVRTKVFYSNASWLKEMSILVQKEPVG